MSFLRTAANKVGVGNNLKVLYQCVVLHVLLQGRRKRAHGGLKDEGNGRLPIRNVHESCNINAMVFSFYPRAIRIWNMITPKIYQHKKPKIISRSYYGTPFQHTSSPKLPLKHNAQRKLIHGVGMENVYVCMWQDSDSIHTHNQPIQHFRLTSYT